MPTPKDKKIVNRFECDFEALGELAGSCRSCKADGLIGVVSESKWMEQELVREKAAAVASRPRMGVIAGMAELMQQGCRLDVEG